MVTVPRYVCLMRQHFSAQLDLVFDELAEIAVQVQTATRRATEALLLGDATLAEAVISGDAAVDALRDRVEDKCFRILSLQQPVAGDLRTVVAALRMVAELERSGDLAVHVAKIARLRVPGLAVPEAVVPVVQRMSALAVDMMGRTAAIIAGRDVAEILELRQVEAEMDELRADMLADIVGADWAHGVEPAVDLALLGRYYERIGDHAVSVAKRVDYVVTGERP